MASLPPFSEAELAGRLARAREHMSSQGLTAALISSPENIYYLTGLDHWGYFALHLLVVPLEGDLQLITRAMEAETIQGLVPPVLHSGYRDDEDPAEHTSEQLRKLGLAGARIGIEEDTLFLTPRVARRLAGALPAATWVDVSGMIDGLRLVKSEAELAYVRQAASVTEAMMRAAIATAHEDVSEAEIAAQVHVAMIMAGGEYPGFGPFIRSTPTLGQEHVTWGTHRLEVGDRLFLEMAGCMHRYHAPMGRLLFVGAEPPWLKAIQQVCMEAFDCVVATIRPGVTAGVVYDAWQARVDSAGLSHYQRHHCGYMVGIGFPPSWVGGNKVVGLRRGSGMVLKQGMTMHLLSWLVGSGKGDYFASNTAMVTARGCEVLTALPGETAVV